MTHLCLSTQLEDSCTSIGTSRKCLRSCKKCDLIVPSRPSDTSIACLAAFHFFKVGSSLKWSCGYEGSILAPNTLQSAQHPFFKIFYQLGEKKPEFKASHTLHSLCFIVNFEPLISFLQPVPERSTLFQTMLR